MSSYFNNSVPLYISDTQLTNLTNDVAQNQLDISAIDVAIAPDMGQNFKSQVPFVNNNLIAGSFVPLTGSDAESILPGNWNSLGDLYYQYQGPSPVFCLFCYSVSGLLNSISQAITFAFRINSSILPASANTQHYNTTEYVVTTGFLLHEILPNDTIRLEAQLLGAIDDVFKLENVNMIMNKLAVQPL